MVLKVVTYYNNLWPERFTLIHVADCSVQILVYIPVCAHVLCSRIRFGLDNAHYMQVHVHLHVHKQKLHMLHVYKQIQTQISPPQ